MQINFRAARRTNEVNENLKYILRINNCCIQKVVLKVKYVCRCVADAKVKKKVNIQRVKRLSVLLLFQLSQDHKINANYVENIDFLRFRKYRYWVGKEVLNLQCFE